MIMLYKVWSERDHVRVCILRCSQPEITLHIHIWCKYVCMYVCTAVECDDRHTHSAVKVDAPMQQYGHKWTNETAPYPDGPAG